MTRKFLFILSLLLTMTLPAVSARTIERNINKVEGGYNFLFSAPENTDTIKPLVVFLHGASCCGRNLDSAKRYGTMNAVERGRKIDAYVIAPQNPGGAWKPERIKKLVDWTKAHYKVDPARIYVVGMSLGGYGTIDYAATYPDEVAAAVGMCGGASVKDLSGLSKLPLWIIHGTADSAVPVSQSDRVVKAIDDVDSTRLVYDRIPGMNHSRPARIFYLPELYDWLFEHSLNEAGRPLHACAEITEGLMKTAYQGTHQTYRATKSHKTSKTHKTRKTRKTRKKR
ncbi:MAG: dienelactone hydrolase family protein [Muribaculaceae bacterium]|nr:dienelactone hydrolase family protein [Muribaculaceae bacterium]